MIKKTDNPKAQEVLKQRARSYSPNPSWADWGSSGLPTVQLKQQKIPPTIVLVYGFASNGEMDVHKFEPYLKEAGFNVLKLDYGFSGFWRVTFKNDDFAKRLAEIAPEGSTVIAHSNGVAVAWIASTKYDAKFTQVICISGALSRYAKFGPHAKTVRVLYSSTDFPLVLAQWIPGHIWGDQGRVGFKGDDDRVENYNKSEDFYLASKTHLDMFWFRAKVEFFAKLMIYFIKEFYDLYETIDERVEARNELFQIGRK